MTWRFCPHCGGELPEADRARPVPPAPRPAPPGEAISAYDQTKYWQKLVAEADAIAQAPTPSELVERLMRNRSSASLAPPYASIVHIVMDREVTPSGGALLQGVVSEGRLGPAGDLARLKGLGYVIEGEKVMHVDGVPVGQAFLTLQYWGGERQHKRWHMTQAIDLNPSRHGEPFFMDGRLIAFGATWRDLGRFGDAMAELIKILREGVGGVVSLGSPLLVDVFWRGTPESQA